MMNYFHILLKDNYYRVINIKGIIIIIRVMVSYLLYIPYMVYSIYSRSSSKQQHSRAEERAGFGGDELKKVAVAKGEKK